MVFSILLFPLVFALLPSVFLFVQPVAGFALALVVLFSIASKKKLFETSFVFLASGIVGLVILSKPLVAEPLFPLLSGLFGIPALFFAFNLAPPKTQQEAGAVNISLKTVLLGALLGAFSSILPALSPAFLVSLLFLLLDSPEKEKTFLEASAATLVSKNFFDFAAFFLIGKARSGAVAFSAAELLSLPNLLVALTAGSIAFFAALALATYFSRFLSKIRLGKTFFMAIAAFISLASFLLGGPAGLLILATASSLGLACGILGVNKSSLMGCLIIPSLCFFFGFSFF
jgi:TctA family transporter